VARYLLCCAFSYMLCLLAHAQESQYQPPSQKLHSPPPAPGARRAQGRPYGPGGSLTARRTLRGASVATGHHHRRRTDARRAGPARSHGPWRTLWPLGSRVEADTEAHAPRTTRAKSYELSSYLFIKWLTACTAHSRAHFLDCSQLHERRLRLLRLELDEGRTRGPSQAPASLRARRNCSRGGEGQGVSAGHATNNRTHASVHAEATEVRQISAGSG